MSPSYRRVIFVKLSSAGKVEVLSGAGETEALLNRVLAQLTHFTSKPFVGAKVTGNKTAGIEGNVLRAGFSTGLEYCKDIDNISEILVYDDKLT